MKKKIFLYVSLIIVSILFFVISMTVLGNTKFVAPVIIVCSIYLLAGGLIKLCKMNEKLKNTVIFIIDLLFWLP